MLYRIYFWFEPSCYRGNSIDSAALRKHTTPHSYTSDLFNATSERAKLRRGREVKKNSGVLQGNLVADEADLRWYCSWMGRASALDACSADMYVWYSRSTPFPTQQHATHTHHIEDPIHLHIFFLKKKKQLQFVLVTQHHVWSSAKESPCHF